MFPSTCAVGCPSVITNIRFLLRLPRPRIRRPSAPQLQMVKMLVRAVRWSKRRPSRNHIIMRRYLLGISSGSCSSRIRLAVE